MEATDRLGPSIGADPLRYNGQIIKEDGPLSIESNRQLTETCAAFKRAIREHLSLFQKLDRHKTYLAQNSSSSKEIGVATTILASTAAGAAAGCYVGSKVAKSARLAPKPSKIMIGTATGVGAVVGFSAGVGGYIWCTEQQDAFKDWASLWDMKQLEQQLSKDIKKEYSKDEVFAPYRDHEGCEQNPGLLDAVDHTVMLKPMKGPDKGVLDRCSIPNNLNLPMNDLEDVTFYHGTYIRDEDYKLAQFKPDHLKTILIWKRLRYLLSGDIGSLPDPLSNRVWKKYESFIDSRIQASYDVLLKEFQEKCQEKKIEVGSTRYKKEYGNFLIIVQGKPQICPYSKFDFAFKEFKEENDMEEDGILKGLKKFTTCIKGLPDICLYTAIENERAKLAHDVSNKGS